MERMEGDLPMLVWLKGDEPYFSEFKWDAEKVMETLGIKRSRLNQISGKELRVGRTRINSYIRPVFRPTDVDEYLKWTRPTASHKKSSTVLDEAREKLESRSEEVLEQFASQSEAFAKALRSSLEKKLNDQFLTQKRQFLHLQNVLSSPLRQIFRRQTLFQNLSRGTMEEVLKSLESLKELLSAAQFFKVALTTLNELARSGDKALLALQKGQSELRGEVRVLASEMQEMRLMLDARQHAGACRNVSKKYRKRVIGGQKAKVEEGAPSYSGRPPKPRSPSRGTRGKEGVWRKLG
ncbi:MAG: hypothetical protein HYW48_07840 [Deltaproteobacteria bacterium]|nr:hypothetical protein [Deltaproteobacteria bacterium]